MKELLNYFCQIASLVFHCWLGFSLYGIIRFIETKTSFALFWVISFQRLQLSTSMLCRNWKFIYFFCLCVFRAHRANLSETYLPFMQAVLDAPTDSPLCDTDVGNAADFIVNLSAPAHSNVSRERERGGNDLIYRRIHRMIVWLFNYVILYCQMISMTKFLGWEFFVKLWLSYHLRDLTK